MPSVKSFIPVAEQELRRYLSALESASSEIIEGAELGCEDYNHLEHLEETKAIHTMIGSLASFLLTRYVTNGGLDEALALHSVDTQNKLVKRSPTNPSKLLSTLASLRLFCSLIPKSYLVKTFMPEFEIEEAGDRLTTLMDFIRSTLKYIESIVLFDEVYLTWIEHGAKTAYSFIEKDSDAEETLTEEEQLESLYTDIRVRAYALLKTTNFSPVVLTSHLENIQALLTNIEEITPIVYKLYVSISPQTFSNLLHALTSTRLSVEKKEKFVHLENLNESFKEILHNSVEEEDGFVYNMTELLEHAHVDYIDKLASEYSEALIFIPTLDSQKRFISGFEAGTLWQQESSK